MKRILIVIIALLILCLSVKLGKAQTVTIQPEKYVSGIDSSLNAIAQQGRKLGNRPGVFAKDGDSNTAISFYISTLGSGTIDYGNYAYLAPTIERYRSQIARVGNSWNDDSPSAQRNATTDSMFDPAWAAKYPDCLGAAPLECEYQLVKPSITLIMLGSNDIRFNIPLSTSETNLRRILDLTLERRIVPILSTIPPLGGADLQVDEMNALIRRLALEYKLPIIDLYSLLITLPDRGMFNPSVSLHLSWPTDVAAQRSFTDYSLHYGSPARNLLLAYALMQIDDVILHGKNR